METLDAVLSGFDNYHENLSLLQNAENLEPPQSAPPIIEQKPPTATLVANDDENGSPSFVIPSFEIDPTFIMPSLKTAYKNDEECCLPDTDLDHHVSSETEEEQQPKDSSKFKISLLEELYKLRRELIEFRTEVQINFKSMDFRKMKKNRTLKNRCTFVNRRKEGCRGYICKVPGSKLCYAHHVMSTANQFPEKRQKLY